MEFIVGVIVGMALFLFSRRVNVPQNYAEVAVSDAIRRNFQGEAYHLVNNVTLQNGGGTTQIDHILVSQFGIFVIETKGYKGWIFGNAENRQWTQVLYRARFRFGNPIWQNAGHVAAVRNLFKLDERVFHSVIVFCGQPEFKTELPENVIHYRDLIRYIRSFSHEAITQTQLVYSVGRIETKRLDRCPEVDEQHRNNVAMHLERRSRQFRRY